MTTLHTLASGSGGNAALLSRGGTHILLDAGISCRRIARCLSHLGLAPEALSLVAVTHSHGDHIGGLRALLSKTACPILSTPRACRELAFLLPESEERLWAAAGPVKVEEIYITPVPAAHDAPGTCGFRLDTPEGGVGLLSDTGYITQEALDLLPGVALMLLEANHDLSLLRQGRYPDALKRRISGPQGHLCNEDAAEFAVTLARAGAEKIVLTHLSRENNTPQLALSAVSQALSAAGLSPSLSVAPRDAPGPCHKLEASACKKSPFSVPGG